MSDIPFVNALGDALETALARNPTAASRRRRRRRLGACGAAGVLVLAGAGAAASTLFSSEQQATSDIECYQAQSLDRSVYEEPAFGRDPIAVCRQAMASPGYPVPPLVACAGKTTVAVIPGRTSADCRRAGFKPLGAEYARYQDKVARLQRAVLALEAKVDCLPPAEFVARLQGLLDSTGWQGWTARLTTRQHQYGYPCGAVTARGGGIQRTLAGAFDDAGQVPGPGKFVLVRTTWANSTDQLLYGAHGGVFLPLERRSGESCLTTAGLTALVERALRPGGLRTRVIVTHPRGAAFEDRRQLRFDAGCSVLEMLQPARAPGVVVLTIARKAR